MTNLARAIAVGAVLALSACAGLGGRPLPPGVLALELTEPIVIPSGFAHTNFQGGRQVGGVDRYGPWCELEIDTVSEQPQRVAPEVLSVASVSRAFIRDYNTRAPALLGGLSCTDLVFKETTWWMDRSGGSPVIYLRCLAPYTHCQFGPPLSPNQIQAVIGPKAQVLAGGTSSRRATVQKQLKTL